MLMIQQTLERKFYDCILLDLTMSAVDCSIDYSIIFFR